MSVLGKRKQRHQQNVQSTSQSDDENGNYLKAFQRAFEAKFQPLEDPNSSARHKVEPEENIENSISEDSDWEGFESQDGDDSLDEDEDILVIKHGHDRQQEPLSKAEARAFMNSKPPSDGEAKRDSTKKTPKSENDEENESLNLKNDLALQRLINESHLLDESKTKGELSGYRQKLLDKRLQALGSKSSILEQQKMPLSHRKGIIAKAHERESKRRREAQENGIILEKATKPRKSTGDKMRVRGIGGPNVGKFKGGTLQLSKKDVAEIKGSSTRARAPKHRRKR